MFLYFTFELLGSNSIANVLDELDPGGQRQFVRGKGNVEFI